MSEVLGGVDVTGEAQGGHSGGSSPSPPSQLLIV